MIARTIHLLTALVALAALASTAAAAPGPLSVSVEDTGVLCPAISPNDSSEFPIESVISGGCSTHLTVAEGGVTLTAHIFGIESTDFVCQMESTARIAGNGEGYLVGTALTGPSCTRRACDNATGQPEAWEIHAEETASGTQRLELHFCMENSNGTGGRVTCHLFLPLASNAGGTHRFELGTVNVNDVPQEAGCEGFTGYRGEISGHWMSEGSTLEMTHPAG